MRAVVVGAGISGVASAIWLQRAGVEVTLVDRVRPGDPAQTSFGNAGILARCAVVPVSVPGLMAKAPGMLLDPNSPLFLRWSYLPKLLPWLVPFLRNGKKERVEAIVQALEPLTGDSVDQHMALAKGTGAEKYIRQGDYIYLYRSRADFEADGFGMALRAAHGFEPELREEGALREADPALSAAYTFGAAFTEHGWIGAPGPYVAALAAHFEEAGGTFRQAEVADVAEGRVTFAGGEQVVADKVVLAAGIWSRKLAERLGHRVNMEAERGYHVMLENPSAKPPVPYMVADAKFAAVPMDQGLRCAGIVELGGTKAGPSQVPIDLLKNRIREVYPGLSWDREETWLGFRPSTVDSLPMVGASPKAPGVIFAFGAQHVGLTMGPRVGRMVAGIATGATPNVDMTPYRVDRFD